VFNHRSNFRELATGMAYTLPEPVPEDAAVELLDGDEVVIPSPEIRVFRFGSGVSFATADE
jgi:hypothetical protein